MTQPDMRPHITVAIPTPDQGPRLAAAIGSIASARTTHAQVEVHANFVRPVARFVEHLGVTDQCGGQLA
jgi:hypothetical protein